MTAVAKARAFPRANAANRCSIPRPAAARIHLGEIIFRSTRPSQLFRQAIRWLGPKQPLRCWRILTRDTNASATPLINGRDQRGRRSECLSGFRLTVERSVSGLWNGHFNFENCCNASRGSPVTKARPSIKELVSRLPGLPAN